MQITEIDNLKSSPHWVALVVSVGQLCLMTGAFSLLFGYIFWGHEAGIAAVSALSACWLTGSGYVLARRYGRRIVTLSTVAAMAPFAMFALSVAIIVLSAPQGQKEIISFIGWAVITFVVGFLSYVGAYLGRCKP